MIKALILAVFAAVAMPHAVVSQSNPHVRVTVPNDAQYVGVDRWVLFGISNCELYAFVRADAAKNVRALYWIQFERYIPSMPALHHVYTSKRHASMSGLDFYVDTWTENNSHGVKAPDTRPLEAFIRSKGYAVPAAIGSGSDEQHLYAMLRAKGYRMPADVMSVRFVHLADARKRKELMIIYSEPFSRQTQSTLVGRAQHQVHIEKS
jgi:hypothetical protein